jgi:hypothetical protein
MNGNYLFNVDEILKDKPFFKHLKDNQKSLISEYNNSLNADDLFITGAYKSDGDWNVIWALLPQIENSDCRGLFPTITKAYESIIEDVTVLGIYISILSPDINPQPHTDTHHLTHGCKFKRYHLGLSIPDDSYLAIEGEHGWFNNYWEQGSWMDFVGLFTQHYPMNENKNEARVVLIIDCILGNGDGVDDCIDGYTSKLRDSLPDVVLDIEACTVKI